MAIIKLYTQCMDKRTNTVCDFVGYDNISFSPTFDDLVELFNWLKRYDVKIHLNSLDCPPLTEALIFLGWQGGTVHDAIRELENRVDSCQFCNGNGIVDDMPCLHHTFEDYLLQEIG